MVSSASFKGRDIVSIREFNRGEIDYTLDTATDMIPLEEKGSSRSKGRS